MWSHRSIPAWYPNSHFHWETQTKHHEPTNNTHLSSVTLAMWRPSGQKLTERTQRSLAPPAKMGDGGGKRWLRRTREVTPRPVVKNDLNSVALYYTALFFYSQLRKLKKVLHKTYFFGFTVHGLCDCWIQHHCDVQPQSLCGSACGLNLES